MSIIIHLTILVAAASTPTLTPSLAAGPTMAAPVVQEGAMLPLLIMLPPPADGPAKKSSRKSTKKSNTNKIGSGRGFSSFGKGRGFSKTGTGRPLSKMGTGRPMAKVGTGRPFAKVGTGRPFAKISEVRGATGKTLIDEGHPPKHHVDGTTTTSSTTITTTGGGGKSTIQSSKNTREKLPEQPVQKKPEFIATFLPEVKPLITEGDRLMGVKDYNAASRNFFAAQQAEGFRGHANLRMAGALMGMGRYSDAVSYVQYFVQDEGKIPQKSLQLPEDKDMEQRISKVLEQAPYHNDLLITAAVYAHSREDASKARKHLEKLRLVNPHHPCLEPLLKIVGQDDSKER